MLRVTRRRVLTAGLGGGALLLVGGGLRWFAGGYALRPGEAAIGLSVKELCVVRAIVDALFPADGALPSGAALGVHQRIDEEVWSQPDDVRADLRDAIQVLEHCPPVFGFFGRLSALPRARREAVLRRVLASDIDVLVQAATALKQMAHLFYYGRSETWGAIGYDGPWQPVPQPPASTLAYRRLFERAVGRS